MKANFAIILLGTLLTLAPSMAHAAPRWHFSQQIGYFNGTCPSGPNILTGMVTQVGYYGETVPRTGDNPDSALVIMVTAACASVSAYPNFLLPMQVRRDMSSAIKCYRVRANGWSEELQTDSQGACSQMPLQNPYNLPNLFGWAQLAAGERLEIHMPIEYISVAAPAYFSAEVRHSLQPTDPLFPTVEFNVGYAARFKNYAFTNHGTGRGSLWGSWDGERVDISFALYTYFQGGDLVIEYGTTTSLGSNTGTTTVANGFEYYPNVRTTLTGLAENTTYYWRPKYITPYGTFYGETQTFMTYAYLRRTLPVTCQFYPCAIY